MINDAELQWVAPVLERYDILPPAIVTLKRMTRGIDNDVIRVGLTGAHVIVRQHRTPSISSVEFECALLESLAGQLNRIQTPRLRRTSDGALYVFRNGKIFTVYEYIRGSHPARSSSTLIGELCCFARQLQGVSIQDDRISYYENQRNELIEKSLFDFLSSNSNLIGAQGVGAYHEAYARTLNSAAILARFPPKIVHGDLHSENILVDNSGRLSAVLDFDTACIDSSALEFAGIARGHCFDEDHLISHEACRNIYMLCPNELGNFCKYEEFVELVGLACFRNMLKIHTEYDSYVDRGKEDIRKSNKLLDFNRWIGVVLR